MANTQNTPTPLSTSDALTFVTAACRRCKELTMDEGVALNAALVKLNAVCSEHAMLRDKLAQAVEQAAQGSDAEGDED